MTVSVLEERPLPVLSTYVAHLRHHWLRLVATSVIGAVIGSALFLSVPHRYYATSRVAMSTQITYLSLSVENERQPLVTLDTTAAMLRSDQAIDRLSTALGVSADEARDSLVISAKPGSRVLVVQVRADTRRQAVAGANAATETLLALQSEVFALSRTRVRALKNRLSVLQRQFLDQISDGAPAQGLFQTVTIVQNRLDRAVLTNNTDSAVIVRAQVVEYRPGQVEVFVASGLTLGLLFGLLTTVVRRRRPRSAASAGRRRRIPLLRLLTSRRAV